MAAVRKMAVASRNWARVNLRSMEVDVKPNLLTIKSDAELLRDNQYGPIARYSDCYCEGVIEPLRGNFSCRIPE